MCHYSNKQHNTRCYLHILDVFRPRCVAVEHLQASQNEFTRISIRNVWQKSSYTYDVLWRPRLLLYFVRFISTTLSSLCLTDMFSSQFLGQSYSNYLHDSKSESDHERYIQRACCCCLDSASSSPPRKGYWHLMWKYNLDCGLPSCSPSYKL